MCWCWWGECARVPGVCAGGRRSLSPCVRVVPGVFCVGVRGRGRALGGCVTACVCGCAWARINGKGREKELTLTGSLSLSFSSFVERMTGLEPAASTLGGWCSVG